MLHAPLQVKGIFRQVIGFWLEQTAECLIKKLVRQDFSTTRPLAGDASSMEFRFAEAKERDPFDGNGGPRSLEVLWLSASSSKPDGTLLVHRFFANGDVKD